MTDLQDNMPFVTVIIVNYNSFDDSRRCIESLLEFSPHNAHVRIVVVDNASTDNSVQRLQALFEEILIIPNEGNVGFSRAVNQALESSSDTDFFLLLNPDTVVTPHAVDDMIEFIQSHPEAGAVGCSLLLEDNTVQISSGKYPSVLTYLTDISLFHSLRIKTRRFVGRFKTAGKASSQRYFREVDWLMGACILVPANVVDKVGLLDEGFFMYAEDADWCRRIKDSGFKIYQLTNVSIFHFHKRVSRKSLEFTFVQLFRSLLLYHQKHSNQLTQFIIRSLIVIDMSFRLILYTLLRLFMPAEREPYAQRIRAARTVVKIATTPLPPEKKKFS